VDVEKALPESIINPNPVIAVAEMGLVPMAPVTPVVPVVVTPVFDRTANFPAVSSLTRDCGGEVSSS
jgi:hypothetical protein